MLATTLTSVAAQSLHVNHVIGEQTRRPYGNELESFQRAQKRGGGTK